ncbi:MAG: winged helix-turn-helix transcriptional regulator [Nitrososphaera sp.]
MPNSSDRWALIHMLAQSYALDMLDALYKKPLRFSDLKNHAPNETTRSQRLKELEGKGLITTISLKIAKRYFVHYSLTSKGRTVLQKAKELEGQ